MWRFDFPKLLPRLNSDSCLGQSPLHMVSVLLVRPPRPSAWLHKCFSSSSVFFIGLPPLLFSPLLLITLTSFPPSSLSEFFTSPLPLHSCHTHRISLSFPPEIQNVWAQEGSMCRKGERKMQNITCPRFFPGGFVCILRARSSSEHMRICYVSFWLKLGTVGLIKDAQTLSVHITFQEAFFLGVCAWVWLWIHDFEKTYQMHSSWNWAKSVSMHVHKCFINVSRPWTGKIQQVFVWLWQDANPNAEAEVGF